MRSLIFGLVLSLGVAASAATNKNQKPQTKPADLSNISSEKASTYGSGKTMNVTVNLDAMRLLMGAATAQFDYAVAESFTVGGRLSHSRFSSSASGFGLGVAGTFYGNGVLADGFMGQLGMDYLSISGSGTTVSGTSISALAGYGWFWDSGFNMNVGGGLNMLNLDLGKLGVSISGTLPALALNLGYAF